MDEGILRIFNKKPHYSKLDNSKIIGKKIYYFDRVTSTNEMAFSLAMKNKKGEGVVLAANTQTKGKGRLGRTWHSPEGGLYFSFILRPDISPARVSLITLVFAVAVVKVLRRLNLDIQIKWPNDIVVGAKKICGILVEMNSTADRISFLIVGIGMNNKTSQHGLVYNATSIYEETGIKIDNKELLLDMLESFDKYYFHFKTGHIEKIINELKLFSSTLNKRVMLKIGTKIFEGKVVDFDNDGALILKTESGAKQRFLSADNLRVVR